MIPESPSEAKGQLLQLKQGEVYVIDEGEGLPLLSIHGLPGSTRDFRWLAGCLEGPIRLIRFDMPGFAKTPLHTMPGTSFAERADFVMEVADALGLERFALMGHSMGGGVAMHVAERYPDRVAGVVLLASLGLREHRGLRNNPHLKKMSKILRFVPGSKWILGPMLQKGFIKAGFSSQLTVQECIHCVHCVDAIDFVSIQRAAAALTMPIFQGWAEDDRLVEAAISVELSEALPDGVRMPFATGGHNIQKAQAVELGAALLNWMKELEL